MDNFTIFDMLYEDFRFAKPIRLIECFAGYGSQAMSLQRLGLNFEHWKICEWATKSIQAYKDVHFTNDNTDYSKDLTQEQVVEYLAKKGVSMNYNEPMSLEQIKRKGESWQRQTYNNIIATHNLVNISQVKGKDLEIVDTDKYDYILTYSFPCQDLSLAGKRAGMEKDSGTRSGLLWEVERILDECKELGSLPTILLMENVPEVVGSNNIEHFKKWRLKLEQLGYSNYDKILNAKDYGIPQNRRRCFMVSILGEYNYSFPQEFPLKLKLKDMLEDNVDEKYYLSQKMINCFMAEGTREYPRRERFLSNINRQNQDIGNAVTTLAGNRPTDNFVVEGYGNKTLDETLKENELEGRELSNASNNISEDLAENTNIKELVKEPKIIVKAMLSGKKWEKVHNCCRRVFDVNGLSPTLDTMNGGYREPKIFVEETAKKEFDELENYVGTYDYAQSDTLSPTEDSRTHIDNDVSGTLLSSGNHNGVLVVGRPLTTDQNKRAGTTNYICNELPNNYDLKEVKRIGGLFDKDEKTHQAGSVYDSEGLSPTLDTANGGYRQPCVVVKETSNYIEWQQEGYLDIDCRAYYENGIAPTTTTTPHSKVLLNNLRIRKLTPKECGRLMGVSDDDITKMAQNQSDASLYHLFGDSIVVDVLYYIFKQMM